MSCFRYNRLKDSWVVIAPERLQRPGRFREGIRDQKSPEECPFEPGNESMTLPEIYAKRSEGKANESGWRIRVVPNTNRVVSIEASFDSFSHGFFEAAGGFGAHEIIIDHPWHSRLIHEMAQDEIAQLFETIQQRVLDLYKDTRIAYIQVFKNSGPSAAATLKHPHTQLIALPFIPPLIRSQIERLREHYIKTGRPLLADELKEEMKEATRIVCENGHFVAYAPFASLFAFEIRIVPKVCEARFEQTKAINELADIVRRVFLSLYGALGLFDFNFSIITMPPVRESREIGFFYNMEKFFGWYLEIIPRLYPIGGFELASGIFVNPVLPEECAKHLRKVGHE